MNDFVDPEKNIYDGENSQKRSERLARIREMRGILSEYAKPELIAQEEGAWERAAAEKYRERCNA